MKKLAIVLAFALLAVSISACSSAGTSSSSSSAAASVSTITDDDGNTVQIPQTIDRIADAWPAHSEVLMLLGAGSKIVATANTPKSVPWMFKVNPSLENAITTTDKTFNTEALATKNPDIFFTYAGDPNEAKIQSMGIPVVALSFTNYDEMKKTVSTTAEVLGGTAPARAAEYNAYLDSTVASITKVTSALSDSEKPTVLHIQSLNPLKVDGSGTIIDDWIKDAGGINAAADIKGNMMEVSMEQVLSWDPDVIIIGDFSTDGATQIEGDAQWQSIKAVLNGNVYNNPRGVYSWDRYSTEEVLQLQWAAKTLHPDLFPSLDISQAIKDYYQTYLNYSLTDSDVQNILGSKS